MNSEAQQLEKIRFSITRLKQWRRHKTQRCREGAWKDKILDYEIETFRDAHSKLVYLLSWKDKILDYEIETLHPVKHSPATSYLEKIRFSITRLKLYGNSVYRNKAGSSWKDKILDYEIETQIARQLIQARLCRLEKIRFSITRLKHED